MYNASLTIKQHIINFYINIRAYKLPTCAHLNTERLVFWMKYFRKEAVPQIGYEVFSREELCLFSSMPMKLNNDLERR